MQTPDAPAAEATELQRRNRELALVGDLALAINARLELPHLLTAFAARLREIVAFDDLEIVLPTGSWHGEVKAAWPQRPLEGEVAVLDTGAEGRACASCEVLLIGEGRWQMSATSACPSLEASRFRSSICMPLAIAGKGRGMLWLRALDPEAYGADDIRLVELVAAHLAVALSNAEALAAVQALAKVRADFFALASHQLRTPLTVARGYADILAGQWDVLTADERQLYLGRVSRSYGLLADLVDEMMDIARIEGGVAALRIEPVDLLAVTGDSLETLGERPGGPRVKFREESCHVLGDRFRVEQVITNLLDNALKYAEGPGHVAITWEQVPNSRIRIGVSNPCPDLSAAELQILFQPFRRLDRHAHLPGTGLGLRACKGLVELMGGAIGVSSAGGRFLVWLDLPAGQVSDESAVP